MLSEEWSVAGKAEGTSAEEGARNGFEKVLDAAMGIAEAWNEKANKWLRENSITFTQFRAILLLSKAGSQTLGQLSEGLSRARCTVTGLVDRLEAKGLVKRKRSREDRRMVYVSLTDKGRELAQELKEKVVPEIARLGERLMGRLTDSEAAALHGALGKLSDGIGEI